MKAIVDVDVKNFDEITRTTIKSLQKQNKSLTAKLKLAESKIYKLETEMFNLNRDKEKLQRVRRMVREFAEAFDIPLESSDR